MSSGTQSIPPPGRRILVVDDEELIRWSIQKQLEKSGYTVVCLDSGEKCLKELDQIDPDLLVLDMRLPGLDGLQVLDKVKALRPELPAIILTAYGSVDLAVEAMRKGAVDFIGKPFDLVALELKVSRCLDNLRLRKKVAGLAAERDVRRPFTRLIGESPAMLALIDLVGKVARAEASTVLIQGESGTGKEVVARVLHQASRRADKPFITINCTSLPEQLVESELLGHERGAFTDAKERKTGYFELADEGTLLLDEIGDMPLPAQAKLLRLLENKRFTRVGGTVEQRVDVRVIAATHRDLRQAVAAEKFRQDLFFRLNVMPIVVPPLRERLSDVPLLADHFVAMFSQEFRRGIRSISTEALEVMRRYSWPGNVRELRNVIERAFILCTGDEIALEHLPAEVQTASSNAPQDSEPDMPVPAGAADGDMDLGKLEERTIRMALQKAAGNQVHAAKMLGISRDSLRYRMKKMGLL